MAWMPSANSSCRQLRSQGSVLSPVCLKHCKIKGMPETTAAKLVRAAMPEPGVKKSFFPRGHARRDDHNSLLCSGVLAFAIHFHTSVAPRLPMGPSVLLPGKALQEGLGSQSYSCSIRAAQNNAVTAEASALAPCTLIAWCGPSVPVRSAAM